MQCPHDLIPMAVNQWRQLEVWRCPACGRGWYPAESLSDIAERSEDTFSFMDFWRDPSSLIYRRTRRECPEQGRPLYRIIESSSYMVAEMCSDAHGILVEEDTFRVIGETVPMAQTAAIGCALKGDDLFNPKHHNHIAVAQILAHRLLSHVKHTQREIAKLPT